MPMKISNRSLAPRTNIAGPARSASAMAPASTTPYATNGMIAYHYPVLRVWSVHDEAADDSPHVQQIENILKERNGQ